MFQKNDEDKKNFSTLINVIRDSKKGKTMGIFAKEKDSGAFIDSWKNATKGEDFKIVRKLLKSNTRY